MTKRNIIRSIIAAELVLLIPFIAMFFTDEVDWQLPDFIIVGVLLAGIGFAYQMVVTGVKSNSKQVAAGIALAAIMILMWMELAVGIFGSPIAGS